jgi:hypothetical protein
MGRRVRPVLRDLGAYVLRFRTAVAPDPHNAAPLIAQASVERVIATLGPLADGLTKSPHKRATRAQPPRTVEKDNGVGALEPEGERLVVVAVDDPGLTGEQLALPFSPLVVRRSHPARLPVMDVKVHHRQTSPRRERTREGALSRPHHPVNKDAMADPRRSAVHGEEYCQTRLAAAGDLTHRIPGFMNKLQAVVVEVRDVGRVIAGSEVCPLTRLALVDAARLDRGLVGSISGFVAFEGEGSAFSLRCESSPPKRSRQRTRPVRSPARRR